MVYNVLFICYFNRKFIYCGFKNDLDDLDVITLNNIKDFSELLVLWF